MNPFGDLFESCGSIDTIPFGDLEAQISQDLGGAPLADANVDRPRRKQRLVRREPGHRREQCDVDLRRLLGDGHPRAVHLLQRTDVDRFRVRMVELQPAGPWLANVHALDGDRDPDVLGSAPRAFAPVVEDEELMPEHPRGGHRYSGQVLAVDRDPRTGVGHVGRLALLEVAAQAEAPEQEGLQGARLACVVGAHEDDRVAQLDVGIEEALEAPDHQAREHPINLSGGSG